MNSLIPTATQHDTHHANYCVDCDTIFSPTIRLAGDCREGDLCQDCLDARKVSYREAALDIVTPKLLETSSEYTTVGISKDELETILLALQ